ncbi:hypothetical protein B0T18DRAFT_72889 [Schizothecium vesticola]|uniref:Uncharacterized protein n=1 Tax=Schizothecium vesticola TaxID=314040 RepID=A0AA40F5L4_9PEZI|nr:hypothetical protein B0T18DRAFT_72889 [Schizothecium vesticola]
MMKIAAWYIWQRGGGKTKGSAYRRVFSTKGVRMGSCGERACPPSLSSIPRSPPLHHTTKPVVLLPMCGHEVRAKMIVAMSTPPLSSVSLRTLAQPLCNEMDVTRLDASTPSLVGHVTTHLMAWRFSQECCLDSLRHNTLPCAVAGAGPTVQADGTGLVSPQYNLQRAKWREGSPMYPRNSHAPDPDPDLGLDGMFTAHREIMDSDMAAAREGTQQGSLATSHKGPNTCVRGTQHSGSHRSTLTSDPRDPSPRRVLPLTAPFVSSVETTSRFPISVSISGPFGIR